MKNRKPLIISVIAAATAIAVGVAGWLIYTNVQLSNAKAAYEASLVDLETARSAADGELDALGETLDSYGVDLAVAEELVALLGEGSEVLLAAADGTRSSRESIDGFEALKAPADSAGELPDNPDVDDYNTLRGATETLIADWKSYTSAIKDAADSFEADLAALAVLWQAQIDTAADSAAAAIAANANATQEAKDAATAAAAALGELDNPLDAEAPVLWKALLDANSTLAAQEKAYQDQKAAEAEAARRAAQNSRPSGGGSSGGGNTGGGSSGGGSATLGQLEAAVAERFGVSASQVNCYYVSNGVRCDYPGGSITYTI